MKKVFAVVFILLCTTLGTSQSYQEIDTADTAQREAFLKKYNEKNERFVKQLKKQYGGRTGRMMAERYEGFYKSFAKEIERGTFLFNSPFNSFVASLLNELEAYHPAIADLDVLVSKDITANAYCTADGTLVLNTGLLYWLENEDQVAGVLAHEIAHKVLQHSITMHLKQIEKEFSKDYKKQIKSLHKIEYNKSSKALALYKEQMYETGRERRFKELQADSMAIVILENTRFDKNQYVKALQLISQYDSIRPLGVRDSIYREVFDLPQLSFNEDWLTEEDFSNYNYDFYEEKLHLDSIASHPEFVERVAKVLPPSVLADSNAVKEPSDAYKKISHIADFERVPNLYALEAYGVGIYLSLYQLQQGIDDEYYKKWLGNCFQKVYEARKSYTLNRYLDRVDPKDHSKSYQKFLGFMWNLSLNDIKYIAEYYSSAQ